MSGRPVTHAEFEAVERLRAERATVGFPVILPPARTNPTERLKPLADSRRRRGIWHRFCIWAASR